MAHHDLHPRGVFAAPNGPRPAADSAVPPGNAAGFLLGHGHEARAESRRILVGFAALLVIGVALLNVTLWRSSARRVEAEGWSRLAASTEVRRDEVRHVLETFQREAVSISRSPQVLALSRELSEDSPSEATRSRLEEELHSAASDFDFSNIRVVLPGHGTLAELEPSSTRARMREEALAREALQRGEPTLGDLQLGHLVLAVPFASGAPESAPVLIVHSDATGTLVPVLTQWPGLGPSSGAYLVRRVGEDVAIVSDPGHGSPWRAGHLLPLAQPDAVAAAMAATGVESRVEVIAASGQPAWAVTRSLGISSWGIVGQVDRAELLAGLQSARQGMILLDVMLVACLVAMIWLWRRFYRTGLARRERELTERHAKRVQDILDTAFDTILTFDADGRLHSANRAAETLLGRPAAELEGQPLNRVLRWGGGRELPAPGSVGNGEALRVDGERIPVEFSLGLTGEGEERIYTAIVRDIRERVEAEKRIQAFAEGLELSNRRLEEMNAQLEEASRLKSEFLANTSHELRTPLNGMMGFLQLVLDGMCDSPEEERDFLKQALHCSRHLLGLINDVLDIAKIEAGKLTLEVERVDVQQLFDEVYTVTHVQAAQRGVALTFEMELEDGVQARGDFGKVKQVLINLVGNALKFTPKGKIRVRARSHVELGHLMFEVVDTGIGIDPERQKRIFEKFVQGDGSTTRRFGGTGLGLAISKSLVELMGGIIGVHSEGESKGTRMYFSMPLWRDAMAAVPDPGTPASEQVQGDGGGSLVLVVEDDAVFRRFLTAVLQQSGYRTIEAEHAVAGWALVRRMHPAVVVLDYALSCGDNATMRTGWDLAERMTTEPETRHIPVVFVTGFDGELKQKLQATAFARKPAHLVKPIEAGVLIAKITELAGSVEGRHLRILMADDDPTVAAYVRKVLPPERFHIEVANNGEECLHILRTQPNAFDLLMLDLMMPEVSGYDVLREMTLTGIRPDLPVLVLTNFPEARNDEERRLLERGLVLDVVAKTSVHENPQLLPHLLDWHLQVRRQGTDDDADRREAA